MMTIGSLFAGYGGLDLAVEAALGARTAWVSEIDPGACKVLAHRFPDAPNLGDITTIDWDTAPHVDIITGGSPCQDLSTAGRRAGMTDGTRSNLWVQMREAIAHVQPRFVVWENVRGALSAHAASDLEPCAGCVGDGRDKPSLRALGRVLGDLAELGFDAEWRGVRASDVGACHQRFRVFVLAWRRDAADADGAGLQGQRDPQGAAPARRYGHAESGAGGLDLAMLPTPSANLGDNGGPQHPDKRRAGGHSVTIEDAIHGLAMLPTPEAGGQLHTGPRCGEPSRADVFAGVWCACERSELLPTPRATRGGSSTETAELLLPTPVVTDSVGARNATSGRKDGSQHHGGTTLGDVAYLGQFGQYAAAVARQEAAFGHPAPSPTEPAAKRLNRHGNPRVNPRLSARFAEWMMGLPAGWITDVPGVTRNEALRACGNGVVPQQAHAALLDMLTTITQERAA